jgi:hypothetical protein
MEAQDFAGGAFVYGQIQYTIPRIGCQRMGILSTIATTIKGRDCEMLIKRTQNEITISGANAGIGDLKIDIASFSNKLIEVVKASQLAVALDDWQYLLCKTLPSIQNDDQLKNQCQRIRLMLIVAFSQLRTILIGMQEQLSEELQQELLKWIKYMNDLNEQSIKLLEPGPKMPSKGTKIVQVMKYQCIDDVQLEEAIGLM